MSDTAAEPRPAPAPIRVAVDAAQTLVNRVARLDPELPAALAPLEGRVIALSPLGFGWSLLVRPGPTGFALEVSAAAAADLEAAADVVVSGPPFSLLAAMTARGADGSFPDEVRIAGEMAVAQRLQRALATIDIDWEEQLSRIVGDVAAHEVARAARAAFSWGRDSGRRVVEQVGEYLTHESGVAIGGDELEDFAGRVEDLRDDVERLAARIARLEAGDA